MNITDGRDVADLFDLSGRVALVTGATGQLGQSICEALAEQGCHVVITARSTSDCNDLKTKIAEGDVSALAAPGDVTNPNDVQSIIEVIEGRFGHLDVLVNNAYSGDTTPFEQLSKEEFNSGLESGVTSLFLCTRESLPLLREGRGSVINISSIYGTVAPDHRIYSDTGLNSPIHYGTAKAGVIQMTRWIATRFAPDGIRSNCITPGGFYNPELNSDSEYRDVFVPNYEEKTPLGRMGDPEDIKGPVVFLASDASSWMTGENIIVDGGFTSW